MNKRFKKKKANEGKTDLQQTYIYGTGECTANSNLPVNSSSAIDCMKAADGKRFALVPPLDSSYLVS